MIIFGAPEAAAALIFSASSEAIWSDATGSGIPRFRDEVERAQRKRFQGQRSALLGVRADDDDRDVMLARDLPQHLHAVHPRHIQIERDHVRVQFIDLSQSRSSHPWPCPDDFDGRVAQQHLRNQLAHQR